MKSFNFKNRNLTSGPHLPGILLIVAGLFALVSPSFLRAGSSMEKILVVGIGATILGLMIVTSYKGTLIDFGNIRFKEYLTVGGYRFGEWKTLPEVTKVKVISTSYIGRNTPNGVSPTLSGNVTNFSTLVCSGSPKPVLSFEYAKMDKAVSQAKELATHLNVELVLDIPKS